ncbi:hypothetical protein R3W88_004541 [Solanum pinnatisectum]|uniref:Retrotransposon gag domain-containing protein n=1 Tax=Solanum pinnatisectum TaxID=50273 RepID=A0AAV9KA18_9SOLN|nr:hypothetical protein R3W88_004541 [Solanum pinnatisectum]
MVEIDENCFARETKVRICDRNFGIVYASDASLVWENLQELFDKVNRVRIYQLHREIAKIAQGTDIVLVYFTKLKELWAEYDTMMAYAMITEEESEKYDMDHSTMGMKTITKGDDVTTFLFV